MTDTSLRQKATLLFRDPGRFFRHAANGRLAARIEDGVLDLTRPMASTPVNGIDLRCLGMRRSGNHALIEWLIAAVEAEHGPGSTVHLNDIPLGVNGYRSRHQYPAPIDTAEYTEAMGIRRYRKFEKTALLVRSYEDFTLAEFDQKEPQKYYGPSQTAFEAIIIRDPLNLFASRVKSGKTGTKSGMSQIALYLDHFRGHQDRPDLIAMQYNRWLMDQAYRDELLVALGLPPGHGLTLTSSPRGGGSSFDGSRQSLEPRDLLRRWQDMRDDPWFRDQVLGNRDLMQIAETHFPEILD
ncbi:MAG: hypothetical protein AAF982_06110 [Pseudomonadota bacterium]